MSLCHSLPLNALSKNFDFPLFSSCFLMHCCQSRTDQGHCDFSHSPIHHTPSASFCTALSFLLPPAFTASDRPFTASTLFRLTILTPFVPFTPPHQHSLQMFHLSSVRFANSLSVVCLISGSGLVNCRFYNSSLQPRANATLVNSLTDWHMLPNKRNCPLMFYGVSPT